MARVFKTGITAEGDISTNSDLKFSSTDIAAPTFTTYSAGVRTILYDNITAASAGYTIGIDAGTFWQTIPAADVGQSFKWYGGTTVLATLTGGGALTATSFNSITGLSSTTPAAPGTAAVGTATTAARADHVHASPTTISATVSGTNSADLISANIADNDFFRIRVGGTATNSGFVEIATADDGTEPIHVRQYTGVFTTLARTATLLDASGNTSFPGTVSATSFNSITGLSSTAPSASGTAAVGTATTTARADHVHPTTGLGLTSGTLAQFAATTSAQLLGVISDETGSGALVFGTSPSITTSLTTVSASFDLINANAATVNFAGAATTLSIGNTATAAQTVNMFTASVGSSTYNFATGATTNVSTKTLNIGTGAGTAGTTIINMGGNPGSSTSTINLNAGTINSSAATLSLWATPTNITMGAAVTTLTIAGTSTANVTANFATGVTTGSKTVNIGTGGTTGSVSVVLGSASGSSSVVTVNGTITGAPTAATAATAAGNLGYVGMPQNSQSGAYGLVAGDAGKHIYYTVTGQTVTIPANGNVAFQIGTTITFITAPSVSLSIAITTDTMRLANTATTGTRTLAANGIATAIKTTATTWIISGNGLS